MAERSLPTVSVLMPAYNYVQYVARAIESALTQDYPPELLTVVVVDDGSTDGTGEVIARLADANPGRVIFVQQPNSGPSAAINRALQEAAGELVAVLDADDVWLPDKTRRQAEVLAADPAVGLVFCNMLVVDGEERVLRPSQVGEIGEFPRRALARLLCQNVVTQSSLMIRRELAQEIPSGIPYSDWWFAICAAQASELHFISDSLALYREHGANLTGGVGGNAGVREHRKEIAFQRWALRNLDLTMLDPAEVRLVWQGVQFHGQRAFVAAQSRFVRLAEVSDADRAEAQAAADDAQASIELGDLNGACVQLLRSLGANPYEVPVHSRLLETIEAALEASRIAHPLSEARSFVTLVDAEEVLVDDQMLSVYAAAMDGLEYATLAIDASRLPRDRAAAELAAVAERCGLGDSDAIDMLAVVGELDAPQRHRLLTRANALYRLTTDGTAESKGVRVFTPGSIAELRELATNIAGIPTG